MDACTIFENVEMFKKLPLFISGEVVKGFGRGSKDLGCPTANYELSVVQNFPKELPTGVYYGWAQINKGPVYKMVTNIGWCPFYQNNEKSIETHIINKFSEDFYGSVLRICILGYLRPEMNFESLQGLIDQINQDIQNANEQLETPQALELKNHPEFTS